MSVLTDEPFNLVQGEEVVVRVLAINNIGNSPLSELSSTHTLTGAVIQTKPAKPTVPITRGEATTITQIEAVIAELTGATTGGVPITSYQIEYDKGTNGAEWEVLKGFNSNDLELSHIVTGLTINQQYRFHYRAKNIYDWGDYSDSVILVPTQKPGQPAPLQTLIVGQNVGLLWTEPDTYGTPIDYYDVQFLTSDGITMAADDTYCNQESALSCFIPMNSLFEDAGPFKLPLNNFIQASVRAVNNLGAGDWSELNTDQSGADVAYVMTVPDTPSEAPYRNPDVSSLVIDSISIIMPEVEDNSDVSGGTEITSYHLEWKHSTDTLYTDLVGSTGDNLNRLVTVATTPGDLY